MPIAVAPIGPGNWNKKFGACREDHEDDRLAPCRKRGVGRALVEAVRGIGAQHGIRTLALDVWSFNEPARRFFLRCGLTPYNERLWIE